MKKLFLIVLMLSVSLFCFSQHASYSKNFYKSVKDYDLSKLWSAEKIKLVDDGNRSIDFPEPLGYIGTNYQRFYIHYTSVKKDSINPYLYHVYGKTRVKENICSFQGTITVEKAIIDPQPYLEPAQEHIKAASFRRGKLTCVIKISELCSDSHTGVFVGKVVSYFMIDKSQNVKYDTIDAVGDGYTNNETLAKWTDNKTKVSKPCAWGDYRIPNSGDLDTGTGEFIVAKKYVRNGWQSYSDMMYSKGAKQKLATKEENRRWWE